MPKKINYVKQYNRLRLELKKAGIKSEYKGPRSKDVES